MLSTISVLPSGLSMIAVRARHRVVDEDRLACACGQIEHMGRAAWHDRTRAGIGEIDATAAHRRSRRWARGAARLCSSR